MSKNTGGVKWTIIEPNPIPQRGVKAIYIKAFFDENYKSIEKYDLVVHSHTLEHSYEPDKFIYNISNFLKDGDLHCFSVPNIEAWVKRKYTNAINFEHTFLINKTYIDFLLKKNGFKIIVKKNFCNKHSIFYITKKCSDIKKQKNHLNNKTLYSKNKKMINDYKDFLYHQITKLNNSILKNNGEIFLFGGHIFSQTLLSLGLDSSRIKCILDNNKDKQEKRLYGTNLIVKNPKILKLAKNPIVILRAGSYEEEIKKSLIKHNKEIIWI
jgi:hypothetical protein